MIATDDCDVMLARRGIGVDEEEITDDVALDDASVVRTDDPSIGMYPGPQTIAASSPAQILIYGGEAGGGKSHYLLSEPLRAVHIPNFGATIFRRNFPQITKVGGLWDKSRALYPLLGGVAREKDLLWTFPSGARIQFSQMQHVHDRFNYQGIEMPMPEFDELTQFDELQFWYIVSRNRATIGDGFMPYIRATCNPEPYSWVHRLVEWWIDSNTGFAIPERSGVVRWLVRNDAGTIVWGDSEAELKARFPDEEPISFTFVHAKLTDNPALSESGYRASLKALPLYERKLLLEGNWHVRRSAGMRFKRKWFPVVDACPAEVVRRVRYWDRASTERTASSPDPDSTSGTRISVDRQGIYYVEHRESMMETPGTRNHIIKTIADQDAQLGTELWLEQDPAQAGVSERMFLAQELELYAPRFMVPSGSKWNRSANFSAAAESGRVRLVRGRWNDAYLSQLENFVDPDTLKPGDPEQHDDDVDSSSGAFNVIATGGEGPGVS